MIDLLDLLHEFGPAVGVVLFFLGRDAAREERMATKIDELNAFIQDELIELVKTYGTHPEFEPAENDPPGDVSP